VREKRQRSRILRHTHTAHRDGGEAYRHTYDHVIPSVDRLQHHNSSNNKSNDVMSQSLNLSRALSNAPTAHTSRSGREGIAAVAPTWSTTSGKVLLDW
jgi:hypothetical protein